MSLVEVSCSCGATLHYGVTSCAECGAAVTPELALEMEGRLEASSSEYQGAKSRLRRALFVAWAAALANVLVGGALAFFVSRWPMLLIGVAMVVCAVFSLVRPAAGLASAAAVLVIGRAVVAVLDPAGFFASFISTSGFAMLFAVVAATVLLLSGVFAARELERIRIAASSPS